MTPEELLRPRYQVMGLYPFSPFNIGEILVRIPHTTEELYAERNWKPGYPNVSKEWLEKCPRIFEPLPWFAEREIADFPEYVKGVRCVKKIIQVEYHTEEYPSFLFEYQTAWAPAWAYLPATKEEYESYINSKA